MVVWVWVLMLHARMRCLYMAEKDKAEDEDENEYEYLAVVTYSSNYCGSCYCHRYIFQQLLMMTKGLSNASVML